jgi:hypothetical protein
MGKLEKFERLIYQEQFDGSSALRKVLTSPSLTTPLSPLSQMQIKILRLAPAPGSPPPLSVRLQIEIERVIGRSRRAPCR